MKKTEIEIKFSKKADVELNKIVDDMNDKIKKLKVEILSKKIILGFACKELEARHLKRSEASKKAWRTIKAKKED